jgi:hypothetical protein
MTGSLVRKVNRTIPEPSAGYADDRTQERIKRQAAESRSQNGQQIEWTPPTETPFQMLKRMNKERRQGKPRP